jgi:predicted PurR-regulated permease PerM
LFLIFFAVLLAAILDWPISRLSQVLPRWLASTIVILTVVALGGVLLALVVPVASEQLSALWDSLPDLLHRAQKTWQSVARSELGSRLSPGDVARSVRERLLQAAQKALPLALGTLSVVTVGVVVLVLAVFLAIRPDRYLQGMLALVPREQEAAAREVLQAIGRTVRGWSVGTLVAMTLVGLLSALGFLAIGLPSWLALGVLAFFAEFIPFIGPFFFLIPAAVVGLADSPGKGLLALVIGLAVQQLEGNLIQPAVMKRTMRIEPAVNLSAQLLFGWSFGFVGILVVSPLVAAVQASLQVVYVRRWLGKDDAD